MESQGPRLPAVRSIAWLDDVGCLEGIPLAFKLVQGDVRILCGIEGAIAIDDEAMVIAPWADDHDAIGAVEAHFPKRLAALGIDLDVPSADALIEMFKVRIRCGKNSPQGGNSKSREPARLVGRRR